MGQAGAGCGEGLSLFDETLTEEAGVIPYQWPRSPVGHPQLLSGLIIIQIDGVGEIFLLRECSLHGFWLQSLCLRKAQL